MKLKLLFVSHKHPPSIGGMQTQNYYLKKGLENIFDLTNVIIRPDQSSLNFLISVRSRMNKLLSQQHFDMVYVNDGLLGVITAGLKKRYPHVAFFVTIHGLEATFPMKFYRNHLIKKLMYFDKLICVSHFTKNYLDTLLNTTAKTTCIANGIDHNVPQISEREEAFYDEKYCFLQNKKILISVGRPVKRKGFSWFVKNVLPSLGEEVVYLIAGPFPSKSILKSIMNIILPRRINYLLDLLLGYPTDAKELSSMKNSKLKILDRVPQSELNYLIKKAHLFIVPNIDVDGDSEGFGLVALEGAIREKVVLAADIQGLKDAIVNNENGLLLPSGESDVWIQTCNNLLGNTTELSFLGRKAKEYTIRHYSWDKMVKQHAELFKNFVIKEL